MTTERRIFKGEFREVPGSNGRQKWATAVAYNVADEYGTIWLPGCFDKALSERMPTILYGHDWDGLEHVLGSGIDFRQTPPDIGPPGVDVLMEFAKVPAAELALTLLQADATSAGPVLRDVSVGFCRQAWLRREELTVDQLALGAVEAMVEAGMDELSLVVRGAVPGAQVRGRRGAVDLDAVVELAKRVAAGELTEAQGQAAIDLLGGGIAVPEPKVDELPPEVDVAAIEAMLNDGILTALGRSRH